MGHELKNEIISLKDNINSINKNNDEYKILCYDTILNLTNEYDTNCNIYKKQLLDLKYEYEYNISTIIKEKEEELIKGKEELLLQEQQYKENLKIQQEEHEIICNQLNNNYDELYEKYCILLKEKDDLNDELGFIKKKEEEKEKERILLD